MARLEAWKGRVNEDLYGKPGSQYPGMVRSFLDHEAEQRGKQKLFKFFVGLVGAISTVVGILTAIEKLHEIMR